MLDKTKVYDAYFKSNSTRDKNCSPNRPKVKVLYEDDISFYVESLVRFDKRGYGIRYSLRKHYYTFAEIQIPGKADVCRNCKLLAMWVEANVIL